MMNFELASIQIILQQPVIKKDIELALLVASKQRDILNKTYCRGQAYNYFL